MNHSKSAIENIGTAIGEERIALCIQAEGWLGTDTFKAIRRRLPPKRSHVDRDRRPAAEAGGQLSFIGNNHEASTHNGDQFFPQQIPAAAFDEMQRADLDFVGTIEGKIQLGEIIKSRQRNI
jgi:hypothetical protein